MAVAVAMSDGGLITPVLKNASVTDIYQLSREWGDLVKRARAKKLTPDEYRLRQTQVLLLLLGYSV